MKSFPTLLALPAILISVALASMSHAATYHVDGNSPSASDTHPGTAEKPWKTITRAGVAKELKPGDEVIIKGGLYRESVLIAVAGQEGKPITFRGAPGEWVEIRGSDILPNNIGWKKFTPETGVAEPYPGAFRMLWKCKIPLDILRGYDLGQRRATQYKYVPGLYLNGEPLQLIGPDPGVDNSTVYKLNQVGVDQNSLYEKTFYFDTKTQELWFCTTGDPRWPSNVFEMPLRQALSVQSSFITVANIQVNQGGAAVGAHDRVTQVLLEDCSFNRSIGSGLFIAKSSHIVVRRCDMSYNGHTGLGLYETEDVIIENSRLNHNNWKKFCATWHAGGMKNVPGNKRTIVRYNEAAHNYDSPGIWFDIDNVDCEIYGNVVHHNSTGIFYEINPGGGLVAGNLTFRNFSGVTISGSSNCIVAYNTSVDDVRGLTVMGRGGSFPIVNELVVNNLILSSNYTKANCNMIFDLGATKGINKSNHNFFGYPAGSDARLRMSWDANINLADWRAQTGLDMNSQEGPASFASESALGLWIKIPRDAASMATADAKTAADRLRFATPVDLSRFKWRPKNPDIVGCGIYQWPANAASQP